MQEQLALPRIRWRPGGGNGRGAALLAVLLTAATAPAQNDAGLQVYYGPGIQDVQTVPGSGAPAQLLDRTLGPSWRDVGVLPAWRPTYQTGVQLGPIQHTVGPTGRTTCVSLPAGLPGVCLSRPYPWENQPWSVQLQYAYTAAAPVGPSVSVSYDLQSGNVQACAGAAVGVMADGVGAALVHQQCAELDRSLARTIRGLSDPEDQPMIQPFSQPSAPYRPPAPLSRQEYDQIAQHAYNAPSYDEYRSGPRTEPRNPLLLMHNTPGVTVPAGPRDSSAPVVPDSSQWVGPGRNEPGSGAAPAMVGAQGSRAEPMLPAAIPGSRSATASARFRR